MVTVVYCLGNNYEKNNLHVFSTDATICIYRYFFQIFLVCSWSIYECRTIDREGWLCVLIISPIFCGSGILEPLSWVSLLRASHEVVVIWDHSHLNAPWGWMILHIVLNCWDTTEGGRFIWLRPSHNIRSRKAKADRMIISDPTGQGAAEHGSTTFKGWLQEKLKAGESSWKRSKQFQPVGFASWANGMCAKRRNRTGKGSEAALTSAHQITKVV